MNKSAVQESVHGTAADLAHGAGWIAQATTLPPGAVLDDHVHDFPYLSLHLLGGYDEDGESGPAAIRGPAAAFHPAGAAHCDRIGPTGLRTVIVAFETAWLDRALGAAAPERSCYWSAGALAARSARLARKAVAGGATGLAADAVGLIRAGMATAPAARPHWLEAAEDLLAAGEAETVEDVARRLGLTPAWLARAWRAATGEGLAERLRRMRLERALILLEDRDAQIAEVAYETGFADQSHLTRVCKAAIGAPPGRLRAGL